MGNQDHIQMPLTGRYRWVVLAREPVHVGQFRSTRQIVSFGTTNHLLPMKPNGDLCTILADTRSIHLCYS